MARCTTAIFLSDMLHGGKKPYRLVFHVIFVQSVLKQ